MKKVIIIPARMDSKRLPGKPLLDIGGKPLLQWTYDIARKSIADDVIVATSDKVIIDYCVDMEMNCVFAEGNNGTERCAEAVRLGIDELDIDVVVNLQVDEPLVSPNDLNCLFNLVGRNPQLYANIYTLVAPLEGEDASDKNVVKVVYSGGKCHWFSRASISGAYQHIGVYAYSKHVLLKIAKLPQSSLGKAESLEQLVWIETGSCRIMPITIAKAPLSINTQEDLEKFREIKQV